ncbi:MAG TPA: tripartite tricarboxylate transporter substrate binding protein [Pseudolabrys sp.]|jgi:tripartite-type tricarboxylate transporter receptor subunit TctC
MKMLKASICAAAILSAAPALAETVKIVVPFAAGGPVDQLARVLAHELTPLIGADVIVEDKGGAGGAIGSETVARATPDGNTILLASLGSQVISPVLRPPGGYDPVKSFEPVMLVGSVSTLLVIGPKSGAGNLKELIAKAKAGQAMAYGSAGPGTTMNIAGELLNSVAGIKVAHVPYRGAAPALSDLMGGQIDMLNADFPVLLPLVKAGKVKALALYGAERSPLLPDVPTTAELGLPDVVMENWYGVFLPAGTPAPVRDKLEKALFAVVALPQVKERFATNGMHGTLGSADFKARLAKEFPYWQDTIKKLDIKAGD